MALRLDETLEAFIYKIITNKEIMEIMQLPLILDTDTEEIINKKRKLLIDHYIIKSSQAPKSLSLPKKEIEIEGQKYNKYGNYAIAVNLAQSLGLSSYVFGNPEIDIFVYYDNTNMKDVFKLIDLISDCFVGQNITLNTKEGKEVIRNIKSEGQTSQVAIINNFERIGLRFSFYANLYKI